MATRPQLVKTVHEKTTPEPAEIPLIAKLAAMVGLVHQHFGLPDKVEHPRLPTEVTFSGGKLNVTFDVIGSEEALLAVAKCNTFPHKVADVQVIPRSGPLRKGIVITVLA